MDFNQLIKEWILYLKSNKIASAQSDPKTGKLKYLRKVSVEDLYSFLDYKTDFSRTTIEKAIQSVLKNRPTNNLPSTNVNHASAGVVPPSRQTATQQPKQKKYDTSNATDVEPRYGPRPSLPAPGSLTEDIVDDQSPELHEKDVEAIFKILTTAKSKPKTDNVAAKQKKMSAVRNTELKKLQEVISKTMTPAQRKQLWDKLQSTPVQEAYVERNEAESILKTAAEINNNSSYYQNKIDLNDLRSAWAKAGYPDDTDDIKALLLKFGFDEETIDNAITQVVGSDDSGEETDSASQVIDKIASYIKKAGLTNDIIKFMQENFANDIKDVETKQGLFKRAANFGKNLFKRKATTEDVRKIFTEILKEDRKDLSYLIKTDEMSRLGRNRK